MLSLEAEEEFEIQSLGSSSSSSLSSLLFFFSSSTQILSISMPTSTTSSFRSQRSRELLEEKAKMGKLGERSSSFNGKIPANQTLLRRPKTDPDLLLSGHHNFRGRISPENIIPRLTKLLLNVTVQRSLGAIHVVMSSQESTVGDLIAAVVRQYQKEGRRPCLPTMDPSDFNLHYSQFSLECLDRKEKLITLGSRNFFLCPKSTTAAACGYGGGVTNPPPPASSTLCSKEVGKASKIPWLKLIDFLF